MLPDAFQPFEIPGTRHLSVKLNMSPINSEVLCTQRNSVRLAEHYQHRLRQFLHFLTNPLALVQGIFTEESCNLFMAKGVLLEKYSTKSLKFFISVPIFKRIEQDVKNRTLKTHHDKHQWPWQ
jgi:hypothetical protein